MRACQPKDMKRREWRSAPACERERERERERQRQRQRQRETERDRERKKERHGDTSSDGAKVL